MLVSVIVPTYKPSSYIYECLDSLFRQTLDNNLFEILIVLNGCEEPYLTMINEYVKNKNQNKGKDYTYRYSKCVKCKEFRDYSSRR